jgi:hypothetical protein
MAKQNTQIKSIYVEGVRNNRFKYSLNGNNENTHIVKKEIMYSMVSEFFKTDMKKLKKINKLINSYETFEVDAVNKKIYQWKVDPVRRHKEMKQKLSKNKMTLEEFMEQRKSEKF